MSAEDNCYVGIYTTDDIRSRKECKVTLIFGEPTNANRTNFDWKYVTLPCPVCGFAHNFKRSYWKEEVDLSWK